MPEIQTKYFTFGQCHRHVYKGIVFDKDCYVKVTSEDPVQTMFDVFGRKWSMQYDEPRNMEFFPRGVIELPQ
jgi:hypothetical protein